MLKRSLQLLFYLTVILVVGCTGVPTPKIILDDVDEIRPLTEEEIKENEDLIAEFKKREEILRKRAADNIAEKKELVEKEYDDDYKKFTEYANENGYTRTVAVDKYIELSNKKLQVAQFRYTIVNKMMEDQGMDVDEASKEFDKMMYAMHQEEDVSKEPMCIKCD